MNVALWVCNRPGCGNQVGLASKAEIAAQRSEMSGACGGSDSTCPGFAHPRWCSNCQMRTAHVIRLIPSDKVNREFLAQVGLAPLARLNEPFPTLPTRVVGHEQPKAPETANSEKTKEHLPVEDVNWELLPAETFDRQCALLRRELGLNAVSAPMRIFLDRLSFFEKMQSPKPIRLLRGLGAFRRYFGVQFSNSIVALDNIHEGNAIYVMLEEWRNLSMMSKTKLLETREEGRRFVRVIHSGAWKERITELLSGILAEV